MKNTTESGRSLLEIIGVLLIMGLITIGGISGLSTSQKSDTSKSTKPVSGITGYKTALDTYGAIETINELNMRYLSYHMQLAVNQTLVTDEFGPKTKQGYPVQFKDINADMFSIELSSVPAHVCVPILTQNWTAPVRITINQQIFSGNTSVCSDSNNQLAFFFKKP